MSLLPANLDLARVAGEQGRASCSLAPRASARGYKACTSLPIVVRCQLSGSRSVLARRRAGMVVGGRDVKARASSSGGDSEAGFPAAMTAAEAYDLLGVDASATFDDIMNAKNRALSASGGDAEKNVAIEAAYDLLLMTSMKRRLSGDVDSTIRFADVQKRKAAPKPPALLQKLQSLPGGVQVKTPPSKQLTTQAAVFGVLAAWTLAQGLTAQPGGTDDVPGLQLALAASASVYFFRENKKLKLAPSVGYTVAGLVLGALLGGVLQNYLRVDIVPIGGLGSPAVLVSEFALLALWACCTFLA